MGHARALLTLEPHRQIEVAKHIVAKDLTVRETEKYVQRLQKPEPEKRISHSVDPDIDKMQTVLSDQLGTKVLVQHSRKWQRQACHKLR